MNKGMKNEESFETRINGFTIRFAEENDTKEIFRMVEELAMYEKLLEGFEATEDILREALFHHGAAETLIAEYNRKPIGYAIFFQTFSSFLGRIGIYIEDIYVKPEMRGKNFGEALFAFIAHLTVKRKCGRLEWSCLNWNKPSIAFYEKMGAKRLNDWSMYRLSGDALERLTSSWQLGSLK